MSFPSLMLTLESRGENREMPGFGHSWLDRDAKGHLRVDEGDMHHRASRSEVSALHQMSLMNLIGQTIDRFYVCIVRRFRQLVRRSISDY
jgi:hypothetical protein